MARRPIYEPYNTVDVNAAAGPGEVKEVAIYQLSNASFQFSLTAGSYQLEVSNDGGVFLPLGAVVNANAFVLPDANYRFVRVVTLAPGDATVTLQALEFIW